MDTTDGVLMVKAYRWAFMNPLRKIFYNLATTGLSIVVAFAIGSIELLQVLIGVLDLRGPLPDFVAALDFGVLGYFIVALFFIAWASSFAVWRFGRLDAGYGPGRLHLHPHGHADGTCHSHEHVH
jgi:high-affinity nickel-transport protein